ncbi:MULTISPECIES: coniferyl aldehyde dehydrogenase [Sphingomonas]|uniref:Aldehyde dehydrogenase n=1 Tax=Sphingomonas leidyi TaxID=68569 RepID=A0A7X5UZX0_9SPHN|nr:MULTISPECIES: coniferyl aldehyde dehydrogenase [Sphingomonas]MBN8813078.1 coniferyl aldehyde dehydrogenase [Sphingomonas sp.]NIJ64831.1 coniferyl-aldehyde dehydrogenase [Sphingomonas leidyi]OJY54199.1 MAG: coniferyl aldehyde dehydrogenase [Sphingomonas sp. 67-41]
MSMRDLLDAQRTAFMAELPVSLDARRDRLRRAVAMISDNAGQLCDALSEDFGHRSRDQSMITDIAASVGPLKHALKRVAHWSKPARRPVLFPLGLLGGRGRIEYQPKGVVGIIAPWNFPVQLVMSPLAGVFAAGNRAMVKTSEYTPMVSALMAELAGRYFDPAELAFVAGGPEAGKAFAEMPFDHLLFTGATGIARHILHAAADNLTPVTLELGGKSPVVVGRSADIAQAAERVALGKMLNAGQICLAPDYMLVPEEKEAAVVEGLVAAASRMYPTLLSNPDYTAVINDRHYQRLTGWIDDARAKGAEVIPVNPAHEDFAGANARKLPLHIIRNPTDDMIVMQEEIFGPVLPVRSYARIEDAIGEVNRRDRPLALYYFGSDRTERRQLLDRTISGGVTVNDVIFHVSQEELPFGGIGPSGMGAYHGEIGFRTFSHAKAVYSQPGLDVAGLAGLKPPYGRKTRAAIARQMKG